MPPRGPKPKPTHLKLVEGNPGRRRVDPSKEPKPRAVTPDPPDELDADAREEWHRMATQLGQLGLLTEIDRSAFASYCQAYGRWAQAQRAIKRMAATDPVFSGLVVRTLQGNMIQNPLVGVANKAARDMVNFAAEFGMTPSARARLGQAATEPKDTEFGGTLWQPGGGR